MTPSYINNQLLKMFRSVPTMCRLGSYSSVSISRFLLPLGDTVPKAATLGCVSSSVENTTPSKSCAYNAAVNEPTLFQPWQTSIHNECSGSGFAISGRKVLTNAHVLASHTSIKVRKHSSQTKPNAKVETKSPPKPKKVKTKSKAKVKNKSKARVKAIQETKSTKFCKQHRGRVKGISSGGNRICFGRYALQTLEPAWISSRQIEAGRRVMSPNVRRGGKIWVRIYPDKPVTSRPTEMRMGRGKGAPAYWVAVVKPGKILYEMTGVPERTARRAISIAASKMPIKTQFITCE